MLSTDPKTYPKWSLSLNAACWPEGGIEYKFVIVEPDGNLVWEDCSNRWLSAEAAQAMRSWGTPWFGQTDPPILEGACGEADETYEDASLKSSEATMAPDADEPVPQPVNASEPSQPTRLFRHKRCASVPNMLCLGEDVALSGPRRASVAIGVEPEPVPGVRPSRCRRSATAYAENALRPGEAGSAIWRPAPASSPAARDGVRCVEVVFDADPSTRWRLQRDSGDASWSIEFADTGLNVGVHAFHFLVDGQRSVSAAHLAQGSSNAALFNGAVRRYFEATAIAAQEDESPCSARSGNLRTWGGRTSSAVEPSPKSQLKSLARPHSISANLAALNESSSSDDDEDLMSSAQMKRAPTKHDPFPEDIYQGLFDASLRLRLHGFALPPPGGDAATELRFRAAGYQLKKPSGAECEDAFFVSMNAVGVADGVGSMGQFASYGVNSAAFAADLMDKASLHLLRQRNEFTGAPQSRALAACVAAEEQTGEFGASTISVVTLERTEIGVANLGDSGFMLLRKGATGMQVVHRSVEQQHGWNCPYQLMRIPPKLAARVPKYTQDHANDANLYKHEVLEGDLLLLFSDGLRDNLHDEEVLSIVDRVLSPAFASLAGFPEQATDPQDIASALVKASQLRSLDPRARVPFNVYSLEHGYHCLGGKEDDITVIAAWVVPEEAEL